MRASFWHSAPLAAAARARLQSVSRKSYTQRGREMPDGEIFISPEEMHIRRGKFDHRLVTIHVDGARDINNNNLRSMKIYGRRWNWRVFYTASRGDEVICRILRCRGSGDEGDFSGALLWMIRRAWVMRWSPCDSVAVIYWWGFFNWIFERKLLHCWGALV